MGPTRSLSSFFAIHIINDHNEHNKYDPILALVNLVVYLSQIQILKFRYTFGIIYLFI